MRYHGTNIDGPSLDPEKLNVRGKDLNELIGQTSYTAAVFHLLTGEQPSAEQEHALDTFLLDALRAVPAGHAMLTAVEITAASGASVSRALIAGLMVNAEPLRASLCSAEKMGPCGLNPSLQEGLFVFAVTPLLLAHAVRVRAGRSAPLEPWLASLSKAEDYLGALVFLVEARQASEAMTRKLLNDVLVTFHAGFGFLAPTTHLPREASGTGVPMPQAIAAGFTAAGPSHVGACEEAMKLLRGLQGGEPSSSPERIAAVVERLLGAGQIVPGFGHPIFERDPRPPHLRRLLAGLAYEPEPIRHYDELARLVREKLGLNPNVDSICAAILVSLGVEPDFGTGLFLCSRSAAMIAHAHERRETKPPFGLRSRIVRKVLKSVDKEDFEYSPF